MNEDLNQEENLLPVETSEAISQEAPKKKRGRKPKAISTDETLEETPKPKRTRKPKVSESEVKNPEALSNENLASNSSQESFDFTEDKSKKIDTDNNQSSQKQAPRLELQDDSSPSNNDDNYDEEAEFEKYNRHNRQREFNKRNDEFSYTGDSEYQPTESDIDDSDDEIPTSFKTDDDDLVQDSYRNKDFDEQDDDAQIKQSDTQIQDAQGDSENSENLLQETQGNQNRNQKFQNNNRNQQNQRNQQNNQNRNQRFQNNNRNNQNNNRNNNQNRNNQNNNRNNNQNRNQQNQRNQQNNQNRQIANRQQNKWLKLGDRRSDEIFDPTSYLEWDSLKTKEGLETLKNSITDDSKVFDYASYWGISQHDLQQKLADDGVEFDKFAGLNGMFSQFLKFVASQNAVLKVNGILDVFEGNQGGAICFACDSYRLKKFNVYVPQKVIEQNGLLRGCEVSGIALAPRVDSKDISPVLVRVDTVMSMSAEQARALTPFNELTPYYPTRRIILEADASATWDNLSMRVVDLLTPLGLGQRALIVAPPRTGKTVLMQGMAKSIRRNAPNSHLIVLMVDERPEEVTDFKRTVDAEIIASTFDEDAFSHVHAAEMVISKARRMVEAGKDVVILLDSITRLARAYNTLMPNSGKIMSGGVEANALQKPKRFFGSARNIEGGGSLTIIGTALVETGSKMDEVIFEEFKGTGNLELHLDRSLVDKRIFPAINIEKSGTRKEELLYHPDEMAKIYSLRRAMKGVPSAESMELLIQRLKKVKTNVEFLVGINR